MQHENQNDYEFEKLLTVADVASWLNVHPDTVRRYEREGLIDSIILNETPRYRTIRFRRSAVEKFINERTTESPQVGRVRRIDHSKLSVRKFAGR